MSQILEHDRGFQNWVNSTMSVKSDSKNSLCSNNNNSVAVGSGNGERALHVYSPGVAAAVAEGAAVTQCTD